MSDRTQVYEIDADLGNQRIWTAAWQDMQERVTRGERILAEAYLTTSLSDELNLDIIYSEYVLRCEAGNRPSAQEFIDRFPRYADALRRQFALDMTLSSISPDSDRSCELGTAKDLSVKSPQKIGKYTVIGRLPSGGQSEVFRVADPDLQRELVIKLAAAGTHAELHQQQIVEEGKILVQFEHSCINRVYDLGVHEGRVYLVSRYARGLTLDQYAQMSRLEPRRVATMVAKIARALGEAHHKGVAHLDIKPENIVIEEDGTPCLIDFGLSVLRTGFQQPALSSDMIRGTLCYMPPEQANANAEAIGPKCDVFSLGAVLYFLCVGQPPYERDQLSAMLSKVQSGEWRRGLLESSGAPSVLCQIATTALSPNPSERFRNMDDMADALESFASPPRRQWRTGQKLAIASLLLLVILVGVLLTRHKGPIDNTAIDSAELSVKAYNSGSYFDVDQLVPLESGDAIRISATIPSNTFGSLILLPSQGDARELAAVSPSSEPQDLRFPADSGKAAPIVGQAGTDIVLLCVSQTPVPLTVVQSAKKRLGDCPSMDPLTVIVADLQGTYFRQQARDLGSAIDLPDADDLARDHLDNIRRALVPHVVDLRAVAVVHE